MRTLDLLVVAILCVLASNSKWSAAQKIDPDVYRDICGVIQDKGYPCEKHTVVTKDSFILQIARIPYSPFTYASANANAPRQNITVPRPTTLLLPGLFCTTMMFLNSYSQALPYELSDAGYDVWLVNHRARPLEPQTTNITLHQYLKPEEPEFWDWTIDQVVDYDLPASIDLITKTSGLDTIAAFIGHSQGGIIGYAFFSAYPELAKKFDLFFPLGGPANDPRPQTSSATPLTLNPSIFTPISSPSHTQTISAPKPTNCPWCFDQNSVARGCCELDYITTASGLWNLTIEACILDPTLCQEIICLGAGCDGPSTMNATRLPVMLAHYPSVSSGRNVAQIGQLGLGFARYDYGFLENMEYYGKTVPPAYDITTITQPKIAIFYGTNDRLCPELVIEHVMSLLRIDTLIFKKRIVGFGHNDYVFNFNAKAVIYNELIALLNTHHRRPSTIHV